MKKTYFNLSCGIEGLPRWRAQNPTGLYGFIRIQSTALEQKRWAFVINDLDSDFLMHLAIGCEVEVVDFSSRKSVPRALYQGVPWIRYALHRCWFPATPPPEAYVRGVKVTSQFEQQFQTCRKDIETKLRYYRKYISENQSEVRLTGVSPTEYALTDTGHAQYDGQNVQAAIYQALILHT